jgi:hypothetical protein
MSTIVYAYMHAVRAQIGLIYLFTSIVRLAHAYCSGVVNVEPSQYCTNPSSDIFLITVEKPAVPFAVHAVTFEIFGLDAGYSMWNTGLLALTNAANVLHSLYAAHCSFTENCTDGSTSGMISPAFLRPVASPWLSAVEARNFTKLTESACVSPRPFSLFWPRVSVEAAPVGVRTYVSVNVVRVDRVAALRSRVRNPGRHDGPHVRAVQVEPVLARPAVELAPAVGRGEVARVGPAGLVRARAEVAHNLLPERVQRGDGRVAVPEHVDVEDRGGAGDDGLRIRRQLDGAVEHDLPRRVHGGLPDRRSASGERGSQRDGGRGEGGEVGEMKHSLPWTRSASRSH